MNFTVIWKPAAEEALADIWLRADDRTAVVAAGDRLDRALSRDPLVIGESRTGEIRIAFESPLGITYQVDQQARTVTVTSVWCY